MNILSFRKILPTTFVVIACGAAVVLLVNNQHAPAPLRFGTLTLQSVMNVMAGLFIVALLAERAIEVLVSVVRDTSAQTLQSQVNAAAAAVAGAPVPAAALQDNLRAAQARLDAYRNNTKMFAACASLVLGLAAAGAGVRGLHGLFDPLPASRWFQGVDVIVTGATIAGGADGIHQMVNSILDLFNMISAQANNKTAQAA